MNVAIPFVSVVAVFPVVVWHALSVNNSNSTPDSVSFVKLSVFFIAKQFSYLLLYVDILAPAAILPTFVDVTVTDIVSGYNCGLFTSCDSCVHDESVYTTA